MTLGRRLAHLAAGLAAISVSACSTGIGKLPGVTAPRQPARTTTPGSGAPPPGAFRRAPVQGGAGLEGVIGARAAALTQRFGAARIDLSEGDARKLQFVGSACVLDIYLYPGEPGAEPVATHVEARSRSDGADLDRGRCIREVERQQ